MPMRRDGLVGPTGEPMAPQGGPAGAGGQRAAAAMVLLGMDAQTNKLVPLPVGSWGGGAPPKAGTPAILTRQIYGDPVADAAQAAVTLGNTNNEISGLTFSNPPTQAECEALRDKCEELADDVRNLSALIHALRTAGMLQGIWKGGA